MHDPLVVDQHALRAGAARPESGISQDAIDEQRGRSLPVGARDRDQRQAAEREERAADEAELELAPLSRPVPAVEESAQPHRLLLTIVGIEPALPHEDG
jgi:hypothetical protein